MLNVGTLPGRPDFVFYRAKVAVFCDGDYWHGRNLKKRLAKLNRGHNAVYWIAKIVGNVARDRRHGRALRQAGWRVFRVWEGNIKRHPARIAARIAGAVGGV